jgi:hypothetical protein
LLGLLGVSLQTRHDGFQVLHVDPPLSLFVEEVKDVFEVLDFVLCEATTH